MSNTLERGAEEGAGQNDYQKSRRASRLGQQPSLLLEEQLAATDLPGS